MNKAFTIIIPTYNNPQYLNPCVHSIVSSGALNGYGKLVIVNNGIQDIDYMQENENIRVLHPKKNLGWEGGLTYALPYCDTEFVCFQNDDTLITPSNYNIYNHLLIPFSDKRIAAVGPSTTVAAGWHSVFMNQPIERLVITTFLIYFTVMIRRSALDKVGGIDTSLPGGDDLDLSIRFRKNGFRNAINPQAFLIHHGFKTGERVRGGPEKVMGWNSPSMQERTNHEIIRKHGFMWFIKTMRGQFMASENLATDDVPDVNLEHDLIRHYLNGHKDIAEIGCGPNKVMKASVGFDIAIKGEKICEREGRVSVADVRADVTKPLPTDREFDAIIASHILEHCLDSVKTIKNWSRNLKPGGLMIIAVPDESITSGIPLNPEHCHAYSKDSLKSIMEVCGFEQVDAKESGNGISFVGCYKKCR